MDNDVFVPLTELGAADREVVRGIFEEAFEPWDRDSFDSLLRRGEASRARTLVLREESVPVALATLSWPGPEGWTYLEYLAVDAARRGGGLGGRLWHGIVERLPARAPRMVMEIHDPSGAPAASAERETRERRQRFYERLGAVALPVRGYVMPGRDDPPTAYPGLLLAWSPDGRLPDRDEVLRIVRCLHENAYGLPADHPFTAAVLSNQGAHRTI